MRETLVLLVVGLTPRQIEFVQDLLTDEGSRMRRPQVWRIASMMIRLSIYSMLAIDAH